jgi:hypothetical protein
MLFASFILDIIQPMTIQTLGESFGKLIIEKDVGILFQIFFGLFGLFLYFLLLRYSFSVSLFFGPSSIRTFFYSSLVDFFILNALQTFSIAFSSFLPKIPKLILIGLSGIFYLLAAMIFHNNGGFISDQIVFFSLPWTGFICCIFHIFLWSFQLQTK